MKLKTQNSKLRTKNSSSFTLVEIMVVIALLAFLMVLAVAGYQVAMTQGAKSEAIANIESIKVALEAYRAKTGYYIQQPTVGNLKIDTPTSNTDLTDFIPGYQKWKNTHVINNSNEMMDPYNKAYQYQCPGTNNRMGFDLWSKGPDLTSGNEDDIKNWK